ncbi:NADH dehydrogenase subunit [Trifolium repens]|nr:NADH dehydrogenase subunit [Trifolium repens]KAK2351212.1 NADH dehydrogenase subunit [Trifolium repens]
MSFVGLFVCGQGKSLASAPHPGFTSLGQFMLALPPRVFDRIKNGKEVLIIVTMHARGRSGLSDSGVTYQRVWLGLAFFFVEQLSNSSSLPIFTPASDQFKVSGVSFVDILRAMREVPGKRQIWSPLYPTGRVGLLPPVALLELAQAAQPLVEEAAARLPEKAANLFLPQPGASVAYNVNPVADQFQRAFQTSTFCNRLYSFFNKRWFFDQVLNDFLVRSFLRFGYEVSFEALDKGAIEILGPYGISYTFRRLAERISQLQSGFVVRRVRYDPWPPAWSGGVLRCG